jgi:hypothetical protein
MSVFDHSKTIPNTLFPVTKINYTLPFDGPVIIKIINSQNVTVSTLIENFQRAGTYELSFNLWSLSSSGLSKGIYFIKLEAKDYSEMKKLIIK